MCSDTSIHVKYSTTNLTVYTRTLVRKVVFLEPCILYLIYGAEMCGKSPYIRATFVKFEEVV